MIHASFHLGSPGSSLTYILSLLIVWYRMARWAATGPSAQPRLAGWKGCSILQLDTLDKHSPFWEPTIHHHVFTSGLFTVTKVPPWFNCLKLSVFLGGLVKGAVGGVGGWIIWYLVKPIFPWHSFVAHVRIHHCTPTGPEFTESEASKEEQRSRNCPLIIQSYSTITT